MPLVVYTVYYNNYQISGSPVYLAPGICSYFILPGNNKLDLLVYQPMQNPPADPYQWWTLGGIIFGINPAIGYPSADIEAHSRWLEGKGCAIAPEYVNPFSVGENQVRQDRDFIVSFTRQPDGPVAKVFDARIQKMGQFHEYRGQDQSCHVTDYYLACGPDKCVGYRDNFFDR